MTKLKKYTQVLQNTPFENLQNMEVFLENSSRDSFRRLHGGFGTRMGRTELHDNDMLLEIELLCRQQNCSVAKAINQYISKWPRKGPNNSGGYDVQMPSGIYVAEDSVKKRLKRKMIRYGRDVKCRANAIESGKNTAQRYAIRIIFGSEPNNTSFPTYPNGMSKPTSNDIEGAGPALAEKVQAFRAEFSRFLKQEEGATAAFRKRYARFRKAMISGT